jgi:hypothetical protein
MALTAGQTRLGCCLMRRDALVICRVACGAAGVVGAGDRRLHGSSKLALIERVAQLATCQAGRAREAAVLGCEVGIVTVSAAERRIVDERRSVHRGERAMDVVTVLARGESATGYGSSHADITRAVAAVTGERSAGGVKARHVDRQSRCRVIEPEVLVDKVRRVAHHAVARGCGAGRTRVVRVVGAGSILQERGRPVCSTMAAGLVDVVVAVTATRETLIDLRGHREVLVAARARELRVLLLMNGHQIAAAVAGRTGAADQRPRRGVARLTVVSVEGEVAHRAVARGRRGVPLVANEARRGAVGIVRGAGVDGAEFGAGVAPEAHQVLVSHRMCGGDIRVHWRRGRDRVAHSAGAVPGLHGGRGFGMTRGAAATRSG